jgi:hypothetical protein
MEIDLEERIDSAYEPWEDNGRPDRGAEEFWLHAEREVTERLNAELETPTPLVPD